MRSAYKFILFLSVLSFSCSSSNDEELEGVIWKEGGENSLYVDLWLTDSYNMLIDQKSDTVIQVYERNRPYKLCAFALRGYDASSFAVPEFVKSNSLRTKNKDEVWIVDRQITLNRVTVTDSLSFVRERLFTDMYPSSFFNFTSKEIYAVPIWQKEVFAPFYFANIDDGFFWVDPPQIDDSYKKCKNIAYLPGLCVSERHNSLVAAQRFFNQIYFYELNGSYKKTLTYGKERIVPLLKEDGMGVDIQETTKCFVDIFGTDRYVYCLYDGSKDFSAHSVLLILTWDGKLERMLHLDRNLKKIAVDSSDKFLYALTLNEKGTRDVVMYKI